MRRKPFFAKAFGTSGASGSEIHRPDGQLCNFAPSCQCFLQRVVKALFLHQFDWIGSELPKSGPSRESVAQKCLRASLAITLFSEL